MTYVREHIDAMTAYVPGEQAGDGRPIIKLNTNENPYPPSPAVAEALHTFDAASLRVYPDPAVGQFRRAVAELLDMPLDWIQAGNGSDNLIVMIARAVGGPVAAPCPTFPFYETQATIENVEYVEVPFEDNYAFPLEGLVAAAAPLTFIANPGSPTGTMATTEQLARLAESRAGRGVVVIDEAYVDFAEDNALPLVREFDNIILLRTLSKSYSLAGLRVGYAVARPEMLRQLWKTKEIYNVSAVTEAVGAAAIGDQAHMKANVEKIKASRSRLSDALKAKGWTVWPSQANFILARPADGDAKVVYENLQKADIYVRYFSNPALADKLRITVGTDEQNQAMLDRL